MSLLKRSFLFIVFIIYQSLEPSVLILITCFFVYRFILAKKFLLFVICSQIPFNHRHSAVLKKFLIFIACLGVLTSSFPLFFLIFDFRGYALSYMYIIDNTIYTIFLDDIIYLCFFCVFLYGLHKNRSFIKREYHELLNILNLYIFPYLNNKFKIVLIFIDKDIFLPAKQGFNFYKNHFIVQIKQSQWFHDLANFSNFLIRKYLPRIKSWFNLKK